MKMHLTNLGNLGWNDRVSYIRFKLQRRREIFLNVVIRRLRKVQSSFVQQKIPARPQYVDTWEGYKAEKYSQKAILFRAKKQPLATNHDPLLGWGNILAGEIICHEIPGYHDSILFGPRVHLLGQKLTGEITRNLKSE